MGNESRSVARNALLGLMWLAGIAGLLWLVTYHEAVSTVVPSALADRLRGVALRNPNSAAGLTNLAMALALGRAMQAVGSAQRTSYIVLASLFGVCVLLLPSRGGYVTLVGVLAMTVLAVPKASPKLRRDRADIRKEQLRIVAAAVLVVLTLGVLLALPYAESEFKFDLGREGRLQLLRHLDRKSTRLNSSHT
mgnify:CR=1 FL=1